MHWPQLPDYGTFPWWPDAGHRWIHPDDAGVARRLIPSPRVFCRERFDGLFYHLRYGRHRLRTRPCLWLAVRGEGFDVGDAVEVIGLGAAREPFVGRIAEMLYQRRERQICYVVRRADMEMPRRYLAEELRVLQEKNQLRASDFAACRRYPSR